MKIETRLLYEGREDVTLTAYVWEDARELLDGKRRPGVLVCPGGGYLNCSDREAEPVALRFVSMGYHAFVLRYSTYSENETCFFPQSAQLPPRQHCQYPCPMQDIGKAFLTLHEHAGEWLLDMQRIAICGFSAGAHNCAMYANNWDKPVITEHFGKPAQMFRPVASILGYGIGDYSLFYTTEQKDPMAQVMRGASATAYLGTAQPTPEQLDTASPARHVSATTPPAFLWATCEDSLVPVQNTTMLASAYAAANVPFEVHVFEGGPHGLALADQASANNHFETNAQAAAWVTLAQQWLKKRMALPLEEKPFWMKQQ